MIKSAGVVRISMVEEVVAFMIPKIYEFSNETEPCLATFSIQPMRYLVIPHVLNSQDAIFPSQASIKTSPSGPR